MTKLILMALALTHSGCAHAYVDSWHDKEITACGNRWADKEKIAAEAQKSCGGTLVMIGGSHKTVGAVLTSYGTVHNQTNRCFTFRCD